MSLGISGAALRRSQGMRKRGSAVPLDPEIVIVQQQTEIDHLRAYIEALAQPLVIKCPGVFDMDKEVEKLQLADALWHRRYEGAMTGLRLANPELVAILTAKVKNSYHPAPHLRERAFFSKQLQVDGALINIMRCRSQKATTLVTAALSVLAEANCVTDEFRDATSSFFKGSMMSDFWTEKFLPLAVSRRPPPPAGAIEGVAIVVLDNLSMKCNYGSYFKDGATGAKLDMTNWFYTTIPPVLAPRLNASTLSK